MKNIVVLISGRGSNFVAIQKTALEQNWAETIGAKIALVVSNNPDAKGLKLAQDFGIETKVVNHRDNPDRESFEEALIQKIDAYHPEVIVLAGFMRVLTEHFINHYPGKILNIHPAILPSFKGLDTHQRAIDAGVRVHGTTVHFVTPELDSGAIIGQAVVQVLPSDDEHTLADRVLAFEHRLYAASLKAVLTGRVRLVEGRAKTDDETARELTFFGN
ncbi:MAG TPA: phosphoribosylglycinamide formyltransferase [Sutterella sp.]|nr:phosphoribosylglycinamide formyltransferase [Sutterella sp.]